jgi:hypothetical protein
LKEVAMPTRRAKKPSMLDTVARAIAVADGADFESERVRYRRLAAAALRPLLRPTSGMTLAALAAVEFDWNWAINTNADFNRGVRGMIEAVIAEKDVAPARSENLDESDSPPMRRR